MNSSASARPWIVLVLALSCATRAAAAPPLTPPGAAALLDHVPTALVLCDPRTGAVSVMRGAAIELPRAVSRGEAVRAWVSEHASAFALEPGRDELRVALEQPYRGGTRVRLDRFRDGIEVLGGDVLAMLDASGRLRYVAAGGAPSSGAPAPAVLTGEQAAARVVAGADAAVARTKLVLVPDPAGDRLEWRITRAAADGRPVTSRVDAATGEVLEADVGIAHAVGNVWPTDPRGPIEERPLDGLLVGPGMRSKAFVVNDQTFPPAITSVPGDYRFPPTDSRFDQVNTYWHIRHFLFDFLGALGYEGRPDSLIVAMHAPINPQVAFTVDTYLYYGQPIAGFSRDACQADDIVYHELGHAVVYGFGIQPGGPHREPGAMHEALADYFAAAITGDPAIGEWLYLTFPTGSTRLDQPAPPWDFDHYDQVGFGGGNSSTVWGNSMILSSGLWDLRTRIGAASDSLVLEALAYLPRLPLWSQFANALLEADYEHHGERYSQDIVAALSRRRIRGAVVSGFSGPDALAPKNVGTFTATPCCGGSPVGRYHWQVRDWLRAGPVAAWREAGEGPTLQIALEEDSELQLTVESPWGDVITSSRFVAVHLPQLVIEGPDRIVQHKFGTWTARVIAVGPAKVNWDRQWRRPGTRPDPLGVGEQRTFAADTSFDLMVTLEDGLKRTVVQRLSVETFVDRPPSASASPLEVRQHVDLATRQVETALELRNASTLSAVVYDVRGRARTRVWDGPASAGEHVIRWDASALEPGVYFLRVLAGAHGRVLHFVVLR